GGCVRRAASGSARMRSYAHSIATRSVPSGPASARMRASASSTESNGDAMASILCARGRSAPGSRATAALLDKLYRPDDHAAVRSLQHIVDCQAGDGHGRQGLHLHARLAAYLDLGPY